MGRAVEAHMLQEMGQTTLVVFLLHRAHLLGDVEVYSLFRPFIVPDVISQAVVQFSYAYVRVQRERLIHLGECSHAEKQPYRHHE